MLAPGLDEILTGASWLSVIGHRATNSDGRFLGVSDFFEVRSSDQISPR